MERTSGILMPVFSLPSPYGIGTFGKAAYDFVDFLAGARQSYWQMLPVGPTGFGDSPYQSFSSHGGNPYFIDLDMLIEDELLSKEDLSGICWGEDAESVDYGSIYENRMKVLSLAAAKGIRRDKEKLASFIKENSTWLPDYALFMALKSHFDQQPWTQWPDEAIRLHKKEACDKYNAILADEIKLHEYIQYLFFTQWDKLKKYASEKGIRIIGDLPIYVAMDSADVWAEPEWFWLDEKNVPVKISGVPPDYFSEDGQLWGNPLYDWEKLKADGYKWWLRRVGDAAKLYDTIRIDHFRGFESYWSVDRDETTAKNGCWLKGPGMDIINAITKAFPDTSFIAEDLGYPTPEVQQLLEDSGFPGMRVLQFSFDSRDDSSMLPEQYSENSICYTGTHDNSPLMLWKDETDPEDLKIAMDYFQMKEGDNFNWTFIKGGMASKSYLFIAQIQDYLEMGECKRINTPGLPSGNWGFRIKAQDITEELTKKIADVTTSYGRSK